jgi:hypothetical protein
MTTLIFVDYITSGRFRKLELINKRRATLLFYGD